MSDTAPNPGSTGVGNVTTDFTGSLYYGEQNLKYNNTFTTDTSWNAVFIYTGNLISNLISII